MDAHSNRVVRGGSHRGGGRLPAPWMVLQMGPDNFPFLRIKNVIATLHLGRFNHTYLGEVLHNLNKRPVLSQWHAGTDD